MKLLISDKENEERSQKVQKKTYESFENLLLCNDCGTELNKNDKYCSNCGTKKMELKKVESVENILSEDNYIVIKSLAKGVGKIVLFILKGFAFIFIIVLAGAAEKKKKEERQSQINRENALHNNVNYLVHKVNKIERDKKMGRNNYL